MSYEKVFCIGLNKTGTTTLADMLAQLGLRHHAWDPSLFWMYQDGKIGALLDRVKVYDSFSDWPWPLLVPELLERFGQRARFILTRRSTSQVWLDSLKGHSLITQPGHNARSLVYGYEYPQENEAAHLAYYQDHLQSTRALFEEHGLSHLLLELCWEEGDGWNEVSDFLSLAAPQSPLPHHNSKHARVHTLPHKAANLARIARLDQSGRTNRL